MRARAERVLAASMVISKIEYGEGLLLDEYQIGHYSSRDIGS